MESDIFYEELLYLRDYFKKLPNKAIKSSIIQQPYKSFFIKTYLIYSEHLNKYNLSEFKGAIASILELGP